MENRKIGPNGDADGDQPPGATDLNQLPLTEADTANVRPRTNPDGLAPELINTVSEVAPPDRVAAKGSSIPRADREFGEYELEREIARGGMGVVYKARQKRLNRTVALKMILSGDAAGSAEIQRFHFEAEAAAKLAHPGIVPIYEVGEHRGRHFFSMGFIDGKTLAAMIRDRPLDGRQAARLMAKVADAIAYAHDHGVIHRDLKPSNVLIDADGNPLVTDFGLAKRTDADSELTGTGQVLGTPSYMSPEQAAGKTDQIGRLSDVYALGATLYCLLTGRPPFSSANVMDTLLAVIHQEPVSPRSWNAAIDKDLETICLKCLQKEPAARYQTATEFGEELQRYLSGEPIKARPISTTARTIRWCGRNRLVASLLLLFVCSLSVGAGASLYLAGQWRSEATNAKSEATRANLATAVANTERETAEVERDAAKLARQRESDALRRAEREIANNYLDRGQRLCDQNEHARGLHWIARAMKVLPEESLELENLIRQSFTVRRSQMSVLEGISQHQFAYPLASTIDGRMYAVWFEESPGVIETWDFEQGLKLLRFKHPSRLLDAWFSSDGESLFVTTEQSSQIHHWSTKSGKQIGPELRIAGPAAGVVAHLNRKEILVSQNSEGPGNAIRLSLETGQQIGEPIEFTAKIHALMYSPDGARIALCGSDGTAQVYWAESGEKVGPALTHPIDVQCLAFSPDGGKLATADSSTVRLWEIEKGLPLWQVEQDGTVLCLAFSHDGKKILSGGTDQNALLWSAASGERIGQPLEHGFSVSTVAFSADDTQAITGAFFQTKKWSIGGEKPLRTLYRGEDAIRGFVIHVNGKHAVLLSADKALVFDDFSTGDVLHSFAHPGQVVSATFSPKADSLVTTSDDGKARIWDIQSGKMRGKPISHDQRLPVIWSEHDYRFVICPTLSTSQLWDCQTAAPVNEPIKFDGELTARGIDHGGEYRALLRGGFPVSLWNVQTGEPYPRPELVDHEGQGPAVVAFSPDEKIVAVGRYHSIYIRDVATGVTLHKLPHQGFHSVAAFSPDGSVLLTGGGDATVKLWDTNTFQLIGIPVSHEGTILGAKFSNDGRLLIARGVNQTRLIDTRTAKPLGWKANLSADLQVIGFGPEGKSLLTASSDGVFQQWQMPVSYQGTGDQADNETTALTGVDMDESGGIEVQMLHQWFGTLKASDRKGKSRVFEVTNTHDEGPGSLRAAISRANSSYGDDTIRFNIPGDGIKTIQPLTQLPNIVDSLTIDGTTQPGYDSSPLIELDGGLLKREENGLVLETDRCTVRGLAVNRFPRVGIVLVDSDHSVIEQNFIGVDPTGTEPRGNGYALEAVGLHLNEGCRHVRVEQNVIAASAGAGIGMTSDCTDCLFTGNRIGTDASGETPLPNKYSGISFQDGCSGNTIIHNIIKAPSHHKSLRVDSQLNHVSDNLLEDIVVSKIVYDSGYDQLAAAMRAEAMKLNEDGDLSAAIDRLQKSAVLPWQTTDYYELGHLYARTMQWQKARDAFEKSLGPMSYETLLCLYEAGDLETFRQRRLKLLADYASERQKRLEVPLARAAQLLPVDPEYHDLLGALAETQSRTEDAWRHAYVGRLMYRAGRFSEWWKGLAHDSPLRDGNKLLVAMSAYQEEPTDENKQALTSVIQRRHAGTVSMYRHGDLGKYWHNFVLWIAFVREARSLLGLPNPNQAGKDLADTLDLDNRARQLVDSGRMLEAIELYEQVADQIGKPPAAHALRDLYARTQQWEKALEAYAKTTATSDFRCLVLLYQTGRLDEYRLARKEALESFHKLQGNSVYELARAVGMLPIEPPLHDQTRELAEELLRRGFTQKWQRSIEGRLRYRLGEFDAWYENESPAIQRMTQNRLYRVLTEFAQAPTGEIRSDLERLGEQFRERTEGYVENGLINTPYWWAHVLESSYADEIQATLQP